MLGAVLAKSLRLPDTTVRGMTFDSFANGTTGAEMTYKVLLVWKRRCLHNATDEQVNALAEALTECGRDDLSSFLLERHVANRELIG